MDWTSRIKAMVPALVAVAIALSVWQGVTATGLVPGYLLPGPGAVALALWTAIADGTLAHHLAPTLQAAAIGYVLGSLAGILLAALIAESRMAERFLIVHLLALQAVPKVAVAPLIFLWVGFDLSGNIILVALICFFPVFANALAGFRAVEPGLLDLMRIAGASRLHRFAQLRLPTAATHIFAGQEVAVTFALIGCVVMEFVGSTRGIGFLIQDASNSFDLPLTFACIVSLGVIGIAGNAAVRQLRRRLVFWQPDGAAPAAEVPHV